MDKAIIIARKAIESTYKGLCTISKYEGHRDPETEELKQQLEPIHENIPCKLSKKTINPSSETDIASVVRYAPMLFIAPEIEIKPGSEILVIQHGITRVFKQSGEPFVYETHQEIMLQRTDKA